MIQGAPTWWSFEKQPSQVKAQVEYLLTFFTFEKWQEDPINGLLLWGPPGTGKTSTALAVAYRWGKEGKSCRFQDFGELMVSIRSSWRKDATRTVEEIHEEMVKPRLLILDDIGKRAAPEDQETIGILVNARINRQKPTICTTNCLLNTPGGRAEFAAACDSRVAERYRGCEVGFESGDNLRARRKP